MMGNELEPVLFTQFDNDFLVGVAYDREDAIDASAAIAEASASSTFMVTSSQDPTWTWPVVPTACLD